MLAYPVITFLKKEAIHQGSLENLLGPDPDPALVQSLSNETQVTSRTPPTLFVHSENDQAVPIENSRLMLAALQKAGVLSALQEYATGGHGFGYARVPDLSPANWLDRVKDWLKSQGFTQ